MSEAQELIGAGDYATAAPYLDQLEIRFAGEGNPEVEKILEQFGFVRGVGYLQNFGKTGDMANMQKAADAFAKFVEKYPENENAVSAMQQRTTCLRALQKWDEAADVIEELLDENKPFKKKILKRSELMNLYYGRAQCYHIKQNWRMGRRLSVNSSSLLISPKTKIVQPMQFPVWWKCSFKRKEWMRSFLCCPGYLETLLPVLTSA